MKTKHGGPEIAGFAGLGHFRTTLAGFTTLGYGLGMLWGFGFRVQGRVRLKRLGSQLSRAAASLAWALAHGGCASHASPGQEPYRHSPILNPKP